MRFACLISSVCLLQPWMVMADAGFRLTQDQVVVEVGLINAAVRLQRQKQLHSAESLSLEENERAGDAVFLRRACIDLAGRLPTSEEARAFLADEAADKRARLVDLLLLEEGADEWRFQRLADALRVKDEVLGVSQQAYIDWLKAEMRRQTPFDALLRGLLTAQGTLETNPAVGLLLRDGGDLKVTALEMTRAFFRENLHCAHCHDHPYGDWTQMEMTQFAACFGAVKVLRGDGPSQQAERVKVSSTPVQRTILPTAKPVGRDRPEVRRQVVQVELSPGQLWPDATLAQDPQRQLRQGEILCVVPNPNFVGLALPARYLYRDGKPGELVAAQPLRWQAPPPTGAKLVRGGMEGLADWWTGRENPRFTAATALRVWEWLFGPLTQESQAAWRESATARISPGEAVRLQSCEFPLPGLFPTGLDAEEIQEPWFRAITGTLRRCGMDLREFLRVLARTEAYQSKGKEAPLFGADPKFSPKIRRLPPEVVWDFLVSWRPAGAKESRSIDLPQVPDETHPLRVLGRGSREWADESLPVVSFAVARFFQEDPRVRQAAEELAMRSAGAAGLENPDRQVETLFLTIFGRPPEEGEMSSARAFLSAADAAELAWSLINSTEFLFQL